jgi:hydrogenase expression/formation protein HypC
MCVAVPAKVISVNGVDGEVELGGVVRKINTMLTPEVKVGDYVLLHTSYSISVMDEQEAQETLDLLRQVL